MNEFLNVLQEFAMGLLVLVLPILSVFIIKALNALVKKWLAELEVSKPELYWYLDKAVALAVAAAEKSQLSGFISDKKEYAFNIAQLWLIEHGWDEIDLDVLEAAIEAEVLLQFPK